MKSLQQWVHEFSEAHQNTNNIKIHLFCIPVIFFSIVCFIESLQFSFKSNLPFDLGHIISIVVLIFYARFGVKPFALMLVVIGVSRLIALTLLKNGVPLLLLSIVLFAVGWVGQYIGHILEGKKPPFFQDIKFLLIAPLWVFFGQ